MLFTVLILAAVFSSGCMQVDITVDLHDNDPGATITERICVTRKLLNIYSSEKERNELLSHLNREAAQDRMKQMGKGITMESHKQQKLPDGSVEYVVVYTIPKISDLRICNPFVFDRPAAAGARITCRPHKNRHGKKTDQTRIEISMINRKLAYPKTTGQQAATPLQRQILRETRPILCDMLRDFRASMKISVPTRFLDDRSVRGARAVTKTATLFSISGSDLDSQGNGFFENEEILLKVLQMDLERFPGNFRGFVQDSSMPVFRGAVWSGARFHILQTKYQKKEYSGQKPGKH